MLIENRLLIIDWLLFPIVPEFFWHYFVSQWMGRVVSGWHQENISLNSYYYNKDFVWNCAISVVHSVNDVIPWICNFKILIKITIYKQLYLCAVGTLKTQTTRMFCSLVFCAFIPLLQTAIVYISVEQMERDCAICGGAHVVHWGQVMAQFSQKHKTISKLHTEACFISTSHK